MKISERLIDRINKEFGIDIPPSEKPRRLRQGWNARAAGAWSWAVGGTPSFGNSYGSQNSMQEVLKAKYITLFREFGSDISILIVDEKEYNEFIKDKLS